MVRHLPFSKFQNLQSVGIASVAGFNFLTILQTQFIIQCRKKYEAFISNNFHNYNFAGFN